MVATMEAVAVSGMIGVLIGTFVHGMFGAKRSSVGVHRSDGRIMPYWEGIFAFAFVTFIASLFTTFVSTAITDALPGLPAIVLSLLGVSLLLNATSYAR